MYEIVAHGHTYKIEASGIVARAARAGHPYEPHLLEQIWRLSLTGLAVDVGAHVGNHTLWLAVVCGLRVVAFEPSGSVEDLRANVKLNGLDDRVAIYHTALGATTTTARRIGKGQFEVGEGDVPVAALDDMELEDVSVIKVDVEGMEAEVLAGAVKTITRCQPVIYAESWDDDHALAVASVLVPQEYELTQHIKAATPMEEWKPCR